MGVDLWLVPLLAVGVPPFIVVLFAQGVQPVGDAGDDALDGLGTFGGADDDERDVLFVVEFAVAEAPFVVGFEFALEEGLGGRVTV